MSARYLVFRDLVLENSGLDLILNHSLLHQFIVERSQLGHNSWWSRINHKAYSINSNYRAISLIKANTTLQFVSKPAYSLIEHNYEY